jgi:phosphoglycolate phosphatase-like HAD superfamily hydrolase
MLRLITDFDGPIMDVSERYYHVYQLCLEQTKKGREKITPLSKQEFWELKRAKIPEEQIGRLSGLDLASAQTFARLRRNNVHQHQYLTYDRPIPGAIAVLEDLQKLGVELVVMTMRRTSELEIAFEKYNLGRFFAKNRRYCLSEDYVKTADIKDKPLLMTKALKELPPARETWMVGDTEADITAAKTHNIKAIAVLSGIRDRFQLQKYQPEFIVDNLQQAAQIATGKIAVLK